MSIEEDPFAVEKDMQEWSAEMGVGYEIGAQGSFGQPLLDMNDARLNAKTDTVTLELREMADLPILPDDVEILLHRNEEELEAMTDAEHAQWQLSALEWLIEHPNATINNLMD